MSFVLKCAWKLTRTRPFDRPGAAAAQAERPPLSAPPSLEAGGGGERGRGVGGLGGLRCGSGEVKAPAGTRRNLLIPTRRRRRVGVVVACLLLPYSALHFCRGNCVAATGTDKTDDEGDVVSSCLKGGQPADGLLLEPAAPQAQPQPPRVRQR